MSGKPTELAEVGTAESIAKSVLPYQRDDNRAKYLGYRCCGFTSRESLELISIAHSTLNFWRKNPEFVELESHLTEMRATLGIEYAQLEFLRNYRLILHKDYDVIVKSLKYPDGMSDRDFSYLLKARAQYTPQQLSIMEVLARAEASDREFDFTQIVLKLSKEKHTLEIEGKANEVSKVQVGNEEGE